MDETIGRLRRAIDTVDHLIVELVLARLDYGRRVGAWKATHHQPIIDDARERSVLECAQSRARGLLPRATTTTLFRELLNATRMVQDPPRVGFLGPDGTHSQICAREAFAQHARYRSFATFISLCDALGDTIDYAVVPLFNRILGPILEVVDVLRTMPRGIRVERLITIAVRHDLAGKGSLDEVRWVATRRESWAQCQDFLARRLPNAVCIPCASTAEAAAKVASSSDSTLAVLAGRASIEKYDLPVIAEAVDDESDNATDFLVLTTQNRTTPVTWT